MAHILLLRKKQAVYFLLHIIGTLLLISADLFLPYLAVTKAARQKPDQIPRNPQSGYIIANSIGMKFAYVPPGEFLMGSSLLESGRDADEGSQHQIKISKGYWIGVHEVTQSQFLSIMGKLPATLITNTQNMGNNWPVDNVSWYEAMEFCKFLSQQEGRSYRLPTEAEWEYACCAGTLTPFHFGSSINRWQVQTTFDKGMHAPIPRAAPVGKFPPNAFGLYDMHGNVEEWCADCYGDDYYSSSPLCNPTGPTIGEYRIVRGGMVFNDPDDCRSASRAKFEPASKTMYLGFRIVLESDSKSVPLI